MGKRRERRIAAVMAAGRRVKLDLSTEPSGDTVGTSRHDEVGGDLDQNPHARAPNSPSSPGQQQENPLLLLGQYSDDELEEEENKAPKPSSVDSPSIDQNKPAEEPVDVEEDKDCNEGKDVASPEVKEESKDGDFDPLDAVKYADGNDVGASDFTTTSNALSNPYGKADSVEQACASGISGLQSGQDATGGWKIVMHEESKRYYYWNTVTGETSWEVPDMLVQGMEANGLHKLSPFIEGSASTLDAYASSSDLNGVLKLCPDSSFDGPGNANFVTGTPKHCESGIEMEMENVGAKGENGEVLNGNPSAISVSDMEVSALDDSISNQQSSMVICGLGGSTTTRKEHTAAVDSNAENEHPVASNGYAEASHVHSARLMKFGDSLLQKLKLLEGSGDQARAQDWRLKYILEIEIRLYDCKALACYGSSLLPFWWHTETRLNQLELAIGEEEASRLARHECSSIVDTLQTSWSKGDNTSRQSMETESGLDGKDKGVLSSTAGHAFASCEIVDTSQVLENQVHHLVEHEDLDTEHGLSSGSLDSEPVDVVQEANENLVLVHPVPRTESRVGEDADMDVDMEVETYPDQITPMDASGTIQLEQPIHSTANLPSVECTPSEPVEELSAPPPPDEEWIPPPPPDNEPVPPPPPDEPPAPLYPLPPYAESAPLPYAEQYNFTYSLPTYEYYAPAVTDATNATYYAPTETCQIVEPQAPPYYEPAVNIFPEATTAVANPVEPAVYYDLPNGAVHSGPTMSSLESSDFYSKSDSLSFYDNVASNDIGSAVVAPQSVYIPVPSLKDESNFSTSGETDVVTLKSASISTAAQTDGTALVNDSSVAPSGTADAKNQPKVVRSKKRTIAVAPTLRSNRKVSSLVDKWKAVKEELHDDNDDEPEDPLEVLERKRQREIEEWHAQQIASGEARDNANFQPLGGDWRERVKRKKAKSSGKTVQTSSESAVNEQPPNLTELSKDLPSGWQAYWDESSKQVYYGNAVSSETTWTRPTR